MDSVFWFNLFCSYFLSCRFHKSWTKVTFFFMQNEIFWQFLPKYRMKHWFLGSLSSELLSHYCRNDCLNCTQRDDYEASRFVMKILCSIQKCPNIHTVNVDAVKDDSFFRSKHTDHSQLHHIQTVEDNELGLHSLF